MTSVRGMKFEVAPDVVDDDYDVVTIRQPAAKGVARKYAYCDSSAQLALLRFHLGAAAAICSAWKQRELAKGLSMLREQLKQDEKRVAASS